MPLPRHGSLQWDTPAEVAAALEPVTLGTSATLSYSETGDGEPPVRALPPF